MFTNQTKFIKNNFRLIILIVLLLSTVGILITSHLTSTVIPVPTDLPTTEEEILEVEAFEVGDEESYTSTIAKAENKNQITMKAISSGVITDVEVEEGDEVQKGERIIQTDENYNGDNTIDIQIEIAEKQLEEARTNENLVKDQANDRKDLAEETYDEYLAQLELNREKLQSLEEQIDITEELKDEVEDMIDNYEDFENEIEDYYDDLEDQQDQQPSPQAAQNYDFLEEQALLQNQSATYNFQSALGQYETTLINLENQLNQLRYQTSSNYPGNEIAEINRDMAFLQIKVEQELADLRTETAELNLELLNLQRDLYIVRSPIQGRIEKVLVKEGETISPGQGIAIISGDLKLILRALVTPDLVKKIDKDSDVKIGVGNELYSADIETISTTPIENGFFEILLDPTSKLEELITPGSSIRIEIELNTDSQIENIDDIIYIPIDAIFKTNTSQYVLIEEDGIAIQREIQTGQIVGSQAKITAGLQKGDIVINDRRVIPNQKIAITFKDENKD